jgi:hypothetical protein
MSTILEERAHGNAERLRDGDDGRCPGIDPSSFRPGERLTKQTRSSGKVVEAHVLGLPCALDALHES